MRNFLLLIVILSFPSLKGIAQRQCATFEYKSHLVKDPLIAASVQHQENLLTQRKGTEILSSAAGTSSGEFVEVIKIPVVVHVLYNRPEENISYKQILSQIEVLNNDYRNRNQVSGPYSDLSGDSRIEFYLATIDPNGQPTTGIVRKKTDIRVFSYDDRIKFSSKGGSDAWDSRYYLNIWVGNLAAGLGGYSSPVGGKPETDGVVIRYDYFGKTGKGDFGQGRTATHEIGHWLGLNHIWGDAPCGDDGVDDTPPQQTYTSGCPKNTITSCGNSGNMYMNFMDYTADACVYMFTRGQVNRMRKLFEPGGYRNDILRTQGLSGPPVPEIGLPEAAAPLRVNLWPNPVQSVLTVQFDQVSEYMGSRLLIYNNLGQEVHSFVVTNTRHTIDMSKFRPGLYFITTSDRRKTLKFIRQ
jgi:hypothetical protein